MRTTSHINAMVAVESVITRVIMVAAASAVAAVEAPAVRCLAECTWMCIRECVAYVTVYTPAHMLICFEGKVDFLFCAIVMVTVWWWDRLHSLRVGNILGTEPGFENSVAFPAPAFSVSSPVKWGSVNYCLQDCSGIKFVHVKYSGSWAAQTSALFCGSCVSSYILCVFFFLFLNNFSNVCLSSCNAALIFWLVYFVDLLLGFFFFAILSDRLGI